MESVSVIQPIVGRSLYIFSGRVMDIPLGLLRGSLGKAESVIVRTFLFIIKMPLRRREAFTDEYLTNVKFLPHREGSKCSTLRTAAIIFSPLLLCNLPPSLLLHLVIGPLRGAFRAAFDAAASYVLT
jgi:hypothetical protein